MKTLLTLDMITRLAVNGRRYRLRFLAYGIAAVSLAVAKCGLEVPYGHGACDLQVQCTFAIQSDVP